MAPTDPHSFTDSEHPLISHVSLSFYFDFDNKTIDGSARLTLQIPYTGDLYLDTRCLTIQGVHDTTLSNTLPFGLENSDPIKGTLLRVSLRDQNSFIVTFKTHQYASALQWLNSSQTAGKRLPFVYTQCHAIHARSIFPCQDTPTARICYSALLNIPQEMTSVMSASHLGRAPPAFGEAKGACQDEKWVMHDRVVEHFSMQKPIPPYLFAFAVGSIVFEEDDLDVLIDGTGIPSGVMKPVSTIHNKVLSASRGFCVGRMPSVDDINQWQGQEWHLYLENLPKKLDPSQISTLDGRFRFSKSSDWEVKVAFLTIVAYSGYQALFGDIEKCLKEVGKMMFLSQLYTGLLQSDSGEEAKKFARRVFDEAKDSYHPIAQGVVESLLSKYS